MRPLLFAIYFEFWFFICCSANIEPNDKVCINNFELSFFCDAQQFNQAKRVCEERGSYLVKIDSANMTEIIRDTIDQMACTRINFHGGAIADSNRRWTWLDGSKVYLRGKDGYQNWQSNQPNDFGGREDCMMISTWTTQWLDHPCAGTVNGRAAEQRYYICQKNLTLNIKITKDNYGIKCLTTSGTCVTQIEWRRNNETVSTLKNHTLYQELSSGTSILHYENATIGDDGEYTCVTWVRKNEANRISASTNLKVNGTPEITDVFSFACNSSLMIFWNPHPRSIGFLHRIRVINSYSGDLVRDIMITPVKNTRQISEIVGLLPETDYNLQISACRDEEICTDQHTVNETESTRGIVIKNATMFSGNDTCIVTWNWPYNISAVFQIFVYFRSGHNISEVELMNKTENEISHSFEMQLGQVYEVQIHVNDSTEVCPETVNVIGSCIRRNVQTTTSGQLTSNDEQTNITIVIVPVVSAITVIILLSVALIVYKMKTRTDQPGQQKRKQSLNRTNDAADYANVGEGEIIAAYSTIADQPAVYVNYQQNSSYETVEANQHNITDIYETPIRGN